MISLHSNIEPLIEKFKLIAAQSKEVDFSQALLAGVNVGKAKMQFRVFNTGKDAEGVSLGIYTGKKEGGAPRSLKKNTDEVKRRLVGAQSLFTPYELKRLRKGRQIVYKDLEFTGDLRKGIVVVKKGPYQVLCVIPNAKLGKIAQAQELHIARIRGAADPVKIFSLSKEEHELMVKNINAVLKQIYDKLLKP